MSGYSSIRKVTKADAEKLGFRDASTSSQKNVLLRCGNEQPDDRPV